MDPLLLEALRFGVAILAGGIVAVIAQRIAFRHAQQLANDDHEKRRQGTLRALAQELEENIERAGPDDRARAPIMIERSAWNVARELTLPPAVLETVRQAYAAGADLNSRIGIVDALLGAAVNIDPGSEAGRQYGLHQKATVDGSHVAANKARKAFEAARDALRPLV